MDKRTVLAIVLSIAVLFIYQMFFMKSPAPRGPVTEKKGSAPTTTVAGGIAVGEGGGKALPRSGFLQQAAGSERDIRVETPLYTAIFTNRGGALRSLQLKDYSKALPNDRLLSSPRFFQCFSKESRCRSRGKAGSRLNSSM